MIAPAADLGMRVTLALATPAAAQEAVDLTQSSAWANEQAGALTALSPQDGWFVLDGGVRFRRVAGDGTGPAPRCATWSA